MPSVAYSSFWGRLMLAKPTWLLPRIPSSAPPVSSTGRRTRSALVQTATLSKGTRANLSLYCMRVPENRGTLPIFASNQKYYASPFFA